MERIDELESTVGNLQRCLREVAEGQRRERCRAKPRTSKTGRSWSFCEETG